MRDAAERFRALFERSLDCLYIHDFNGKFLDANPAALKLLGYEREDIASLHFVHLAQRGPDAQSHYGRCREVAETGTQKETTDSDCGARPAHLSMSKQRLR